MDNTTRNKLFVLILTFIEILTLILSTGVSFKKYNYDECLKGYRCVPNETVFETDGVLDLFACSKLCVRNKLCVSIFFQQESFKCIGCRVNLIIRNDIYDTIPGSLYFKTNSTYNTDCKDILEGRHSVPSGVYDIGLWMSQTVVTVYCDMDTDGGGWTVFQKRFDGSIEFYRTFAEYENGFGNSSEEFWLGLKNIQEIASQGTTEIRLEMTNADDEEGFETYRDFKLIGGDNYTLSLDKHTAHRSPGISKEHSFSSATGYPFSTFDRDMDASVRNVAEDRHGAWWYGTDTNVNLNAAYCESGRVCILDGKYGWTSFGHRGFAGWNTLKSSRMMIRRM